MCALGKLFGDNYMIVAYACTTGFNTNYDDIVVLIVMPSSVFIYNQSDFWLSACTCSLHSHVHILMLGHPYDIS